jgi:hypothetical protein
VLPAGYAYHCSGPSYYQKTDGTGWIPINFSSVTPSSPLGTLPIDPVNAVSSRLYYTYTTNGSQYETTAVMVSPVYKLGGTNDVISQDGGTLASVYEKGTKLGLEPLDYGDASLVGYWTFDEGGGTVVNDYSGNNASGTWQGALGNQWAAGKVGPYAGSFDGTDNYVPITDAGSLHPSVISISLWFDSKSAVTNMYLLNKGSNRATGSGYNVYVYSGNRPACWFYDGLGNLQNLRMSGTVSTDTWYHLVCTYDNASLRMYVNGVFNSSLNASGFTTTDARLEISQVFFGLIDDVCIYNRALSASEIQAMYSGGK